MHGAPLIDHRTPAATLTSCSLADERPRARSPLARPAQPAGAQAGPASQPASQPAGPALDQRWTRTYSRKRPQPASKASAGVDSRASQMPVGVSFLPFRLIHHESGEHAQRSAKEPAKNPATNAFARAATNALSTMQVTIGKLMLWLLSLDALAVLLQVHVGTSNKLQTRWERFRGGATTSQAILLTSGSLVTLSGAKAVVEGQRKSSEQVRACPPPHALLLQTTCKPRPHCRTPRATGSRVEGPSRTIPRRCIAGARRGDVPRARAARLGSLQVLLAGDRLRDRLLSPEHAADRHVPHGLQPVRSCAESVSAQLAHALAPTIRLALHVRGLRAALGRLPASRPRAGRAARATPAHPALSRAARGTAAPRAASARPAQQAAQGVSCCADLVLLIAPQHPLLARANPDLRASTQQRIVEFPMSMSLELVVQLLYSVFSVVLYDNRL